MVDIRQLLRSGGVVLALFDLVDNPQSRERRIEGIVLGVVTNNQDEENLGRVKVRFPCIGDSEESYWARVATLMAGRERGAYFLPEVGDEVVVAFDHRDMSHPYVLGALWNGRDKPPGSNSDGKNNIRVIRSRSGHEMTFDDDDRQGKVLIRTKSGHSILLDDASGAEKIEIKDKTGKNSVLIDSVSNSMTIASDLKLSIKAREIEIESGGTMSIKATGNLTIQGALVKIN